MRPVLRMVQHGTRLAQRGYSMIELMVAMTIALFLMGGLVTLVMHSRTTSAAQQQLAQLQDNQRIAMTMLTNVIQEAGYFPDPTVNGQSIFLGETDGNVAFSAEQVVSGHSGGGAPGDAIGIRFASPIADAYNILPNNVITCAGTSSTDTANTHVFTNIFQIATVGNTTYLQCQLYKDGTAVGTPVNLVPGLYDMQVAYGISGSASNNVVSYVPATQLVADTALWGNVTSVKIRLYFQLPQYGFTGGQVNSSATSAALSKQIQYVERVIPIMSRSGG